MVQGRHEPLISLETYQAIQDKLAGKSRHKPRAVEDAFPLRGSVMCECGNPLTACHSRSSTGRLYAYYMCFDPTKACAHYRKSIPQGQIEGEFGALLKALTPAPNLIEMAKAMLSDLWDGHTTSLKRTVESGRAELAKVDRSIDQLMDRIVEAESETMVKAYERKIRALEERRAELRDQLARSDEKGRDPAPVFRTAIDFLSSPWKLWDSERLADRLLACRLTFPGKLTYVRNEGFRTALSALPFKAFSSLDALKCEVARHP